MFNFPKYYDIPAHQKLAFGDRCIKLVVLTYKTSEQEEKLLANILKTTGIGEENILHLIVDPDHFLHIRDILNSMKPTYMVLFGIKPVWLGLHIKVISYTPFKINDCQLCVCDDLENLQHNKKGKMELWKILKSWFLNTDQ